MGVYDRNIQLMRLVDSIQLELLSNMMDENPDNEDNIKKIQYEVAEEFVTTDGKQGEVTDIMEEILLYIKLRTENRVKSYRMDKGKIQREEYK